MKLLLLSLLCFSAAANTIRTDVETEIEKIRIDREKALKPLRETLLRNLTAESKQWQAAGKLELVLAFDARKAELEPIISSPLDAKPVFLEEHPIHGSKAEDQYRLAQSAVYRTFLGRFAKLDAAVKALEQIQKQLTIQGKKDEALKAAEDGNDVRDAVDNLRVEFSTDPIVYERWYRRLNGYDFMIFSRNGNCKQTYGPGITGEAGRTFKIKDGVITMTRWQQPSLEFKIINAKSFEEGWKLSTLSEYLKAKNEAGPK